MIGELITVEDLLTRLKRDQPFHNQSGGGVTFSGGEPLFQGEFLVECLKACRTEMFHTAVDTCGYAPPEIITQVAPLTDLFLYDLKFVDDSLSMRYTAVSASPILANLRCLDQLGANYWIRIPLIPGISDNADTLEAVGSFLTQLKQDPSVYLLPYHHTGSDKYRRLGLDYPQELTSEGVLESTDSEKSNEQHRYQLAETILTRYGLRVIRGG